MPSSPDPTSEARSDSSAHPGTPNQEASLPAHRAIALAGYTRGDLEQALDRIVERTLAMDFAWDWPGGVAFYGIGRAWEATGQSTYLQHLRSWVDQRMADGMPKLTVNAVSLGHVLLDLHAATAEEPYLEVAREMAEFLAHDASRFGDGVLQHTVSQDYDFPEQAWADTLFVAALFLLKFGARHNQPSHLEDALKQFSWHEKFLQSQSNDLYYHAWDHRAGDHLSGVHWARANAWAALTAAEALREIDVTQTAFLRIADSLRDQLCALARRQTANGLWTTVLTDETAYEETSASAGIAAAFVVQGRVFNSNLYDRVIAQALSGVLGNVDEAGRVHHVSAGTAVMPDEKAYGEIPHERIQGWGQGLTLAFLATLLENPR